MKDHTQGGGLDQDGHSGVAVLFTEDSQHLKQKVQR